MPLLESVLSVIAPHNCLACSAEGCLLCMDCAPEALPFLDEPACYSCGRQPANGMICAECRSRVPLTAIHVRTIHEGLARQLVHQLKFERAMAASKPMAAAMASLVPRSVYGSGDIVVVPVPTASSRARTRGYDQAALLARQIARECALPYRALLGRNTQARQVGASRLQRITQLHGVFYMRKSYTCRLVILVDDVITTGSSLEACAEVLHSAGISKVIGLVFARQLFGK